MLPAPGFHHLHLNSVDPDAAIAFYIRQFPTSKAGEWAGHKALLCPNNVMVLFNKVDTKPTSEPQSAIWHFGWHVTDSRATVETFKTRPEVKMLPLYTTDEGGFVHINSDTWPNAGGMLGLTRAQIAEAKRAGAQPPGGGGFAYFQGPDDALVEIAGDYTEERFNHIHMWQERPIMAQVWYQTHLNAPLRPGWPAATSDMDQPRGPDRTWPALKLEGMYRSPRGGVEFGDVSVIWYANQGEHRLVDPRGQLQDHFALSVQDLDAWIAKLRGENVSILREAYALGATRAAMIEGPSKEAIELVQV
jgi:catechol 2,3-dioxygenase-like lactoylglutathione lyase family enzyme